MTPESATSVAPWMMAARWAVTRWRDAVGAFILAIVSGKPRTNPYMRLTQPPTMSTFPLVSTVGPSSTLM